MFRKLVLFAFRNLRRNFLYTFIVIGGLSLGIATLFSIAQWTAWQISYDRDIENYKDIYRLTLKEKKENFERQTARILHGNIVNQLYNEEDIPEIEDIGLLSPYRNAIVKKDRKIFYENTSYSCDPNFLEIFRPEMILGDLHSSLTKPHTVLLSEETARKYFGYENPVGQLIDITHQFGIEAEAFEITGIFRNFPGNSHFHPALLTSYEDPANYHGTAWVYLNVSETSNIPKLETSITEFIKNNNEQEDWEGIEPELMALKDIHLESHLPRELEKNGSRQSVIILFIAGILVFLLAWFNFTLLAISQNQMKINKLIFQWQLGSSKNLFRRQFFIEFLIYSRK